MKAVFHKIYLVHSWILCLIFRGTLTKAEWIYIIINFILRYSIFCLVLFILYGQFVCFVSFTCQSFACSGNGYLSFRINLEKDISVNAQQYIMCWEKIISLHATKRARCTFNKSIADRSTVVVDSTLSLVCRLLEILKFCFSRNIFSFYCRN